MNDHPESISSSELRARVRRINTLASDLGFVGHVEYRHVYSQSGGAQYGIGPSADEDIMIVYAEAFDRDANPEDYDLDAMIAHECGHQRLHRDSNLRPVLTKFPGEAFEEILASLVGSILLGQSKSANMLVLRAIAELGDLRISDKNVVLVAERLRRLLETLL